MEVFATISVILLVTMAVPITLIFTALVFDICAVLYAVFPMKRIRARKARRVVPVPGGGRVLAGQEVFVFQH